MQLELVLAYSFPLLITGLDEPERFFEWFRLNAYYEIVWENFFLPSAFTFAMRSDAFQRNEWRENRFFGICVLAEFMFHGNVNLITHRWRELRSGPSIDLNNSRSHVSDERYFYSCATFKSECTVYRLEWKFVCSTSVLSSFVAFSIRIDFRSRTKVKLLIMSF